jgi:hypothetical protein
VYKTRNFGTTSKTTPIVLGGQQLSHVELFRTLGTIAEQTTKRLDTGKELCHNVVTVTKRHKNITSDINLLGEQK